jgi:hypothetical protein
VRAASSAAVWYAAARIGIHTEARTNKEERRTKNEERRTKKAEERRRKKKKEIGR